MTQLAEAVETIRPDSVPVRSPRQPRRLVAPTGLGRPSGDWNARSGRRALTNWLPETGSRLTEYEWSLHVSRTVDIADRLLLRYSVLTAAVQEDDTVVNMVRQYAADFARFQMARVAETLHTRGYYSAAEAVLAQAEVIEALDRAS